MKLESNNHSVFSLNYHLVLVVKYRRPVINDTVSARLREIFEYIQPSYNITLKEWNHDRDHVHVLFSAHPKSELTRFLNAYKSASSRLIKKEFPEIFKKAFGDKFWLLTKDEILEEQLFGIGKEHELFRDMLGDYIAVSVAEDAVFATHIEAEKMPGGHAGLTKEELEIPLIAVSL